MSGQSQNRYELLDIVVSISTRYFIHTSSVENTPWELQDTGHYPAFRNRLSAFLTYLNNEIYREHILTFTKIGC